MSVPGARIPTQDALFPKHMLSCKPAPLPSLRAASSASCSCFLGFPSLRVLLEVWGLNWEVEVRSPWLQVWGALIRGFSRPPACQPLRALAVCIPEGSSLLWVANHSRKPEGCQVGLRSLSDLSWF